jgi:hypothetical protein
VGATDDNNDLAYISELSIGRFAAPPLRYELRL